MPMEDEQLLLRQMPHSVEAEQAVLGSMLIDEECVGFVLSRVSERDFVTQQYRSIFRAIRTLFREGLPTDAIAVREKLGGKLGDGWSKLLTGIMDYVPSLERSCLGI